MLSKIQTQGGTSTLERLKKILVCLQGWGKAFFDVGIGNDSNAILLIHGNTNIADEAEGSIP